MKMIISVLLIIFLFICIIMTIIGIFDLWRDSYLKECLEDYRERKRGENHRPKNKL